MVKNNVEIFLSIWRRETDGKFKLISVVQLIKHINTYINIIFKYGEVRTEKPQNVPFLIKCL